jgi:hypothetical protein
MFTEMSTAISTAISTAASAGGRKFRGSIRSGNEKS